MKKVSSLLKKVTLYLDSFFLMNLQTKELNPNSPELRIDHKSNLAALLSLAFWTNLHPNIDSSYSCMILELLRGESVVFHDIFQGQDEYRNRDQRMVNVLLQLHT